MQAEPTYTRPPYELPERANRTFKSISTYMFWVSIFVFLLGGIEGRREILNSLNQQNKLLIIFWVLELISYIIIGYFTIKASSSFKRLATDVHEIRNLKSTLRKFGKLYQVERFIIILNIFFLVMIPVIRQFITLFGKISNF